MKTFKSYYYAAVAGALTFPAVALAQGPFNRAQGMVTNVAGAAGVNSTTDLPTMIGKIINVVLGFVGILLLGYILFAGFKWMTAGGDDKKVTEAQVMIKNAVIGLLIVVAAFAISSFVLASLVNVAQ